MTTTSSHHATIFDNGEVIVQEDEFGRLWCNCGKARLRHNPKAPYLCTHVQMLIRDRKDAPAFIRKRAPYERPSAVWVPMFTYPHGKKLTNLMSANVTIDQDSAVRWTDAVLGYVGVNDGRATMRDLLVEELANFLRLAKTPPCTMGGLVHQTLGWHAPAAAERAANLGWEYLPGHQRNALSLLEEGRCLECVKAVLIEL